MAKRKNTHPRVKARRLTALQNLRARVGKIINNATLAVDYTKSPKKEQVENEITILEAKLGHAARPEIIVG